MVGNGWILILKELNLTSPVSVLKSCIRSGPVSKPAQAKFNLHQPSIWVVEIQPNTIPTVVYIKLGRKIKNRHRPPQCVSVFKSY